MPAKPTASKPSAGPSPAASPRPLPDFIEAVRASAEFADGVRAALAAMPSAPDPETLFRHAQAVFEADVARGNDIKNFIALRRRPPPGTRRRGSATATWNGAAMSSSSTPRKPSWNTSRKSRKSTPTRPCRTARKSTPCADVFSAIHPRRTPRQPHPSFPMKPSAEQPPARPPLVAFRGYQQPAFWDHSTKTLIEHWSRQIGKSYTYAAWAVDRLLRNPGRLVTVLSNSRENGAEFVAKAQEVCRKLGQAIETESNQAELDGAPALSEDVKFENMRFEVRLTIGGQVGRIKVLAANPRTARGFSGDLILDEFAFHEDSAAIWEAAEPIISSNPDFLCRILSTGNGRRNMFYQLISEGRIKYRRIRRSDAWAPGELKIYSQVDGRELTPAEARAQSSDKRAYDQNYECAFEDENAPLLTAELISAAETPTSPGASTARPGARRPSPGWPRTPARSKPGSTWAARATFPC